MISRERYLHYTSKKTIETRPRIAHDHHIQIYNHIVAQPEEYSEIAYTHKPIDIQHFIEPRVDLRHFC